MAQPNLPTFYRSRDIVDVLHVQRRSVVRDAELACRRLCCAVTVGQVVDDCLDDLGTTCSAGRGQVLLEGRDLGSDIHPKEDRHVLDEGRLCSKGRVGDAENNRSVSSTMHGSRRECLLCYRRLYFCNILRD